MDMGFNFVIHPGYSSGPERQRICDDKDAGLTLVRPVDIKDCVSTECDLTKQFAMVILCEGLFYNKKTEQATPETILQAKKSWNGLLKRKMTGELLYVWSITLLHELFHVADPKNSKMNCVSYLAA
jgi:hypothetical protein